MKLTTEALGLRNPLNELHPTSSNRCQFFVAVGVLVVTYVTEGWVPDNIVPGAPCIPSSDYAHCPWSSSSDVSAIGVDGPGVPVHLGRHVAHLQGGRDALFGNRQGGRRQRSLHMKPAKTIAKSLTAEKLSFEWNYRSD